MHCLRMSTCHRKPSKVTQVVILQAHRVLRHDGVLVFLTINRHWQSKLSLWLHTTFVQHHPREASDWRLGIKPAEMKRFADAAGFNMVHEELQGVCENLRLHVDWGKMPWVLQAHGTEYSRCKSLHVRYMGWAYKKPRAVDDAETWQGRPAREEL